MKRKKVIVRQVISSDEIRSTWDMYEEYYHEISVLPTEQNKIERRKHIEYWSKPDKWVLILKKNSSSKGFTLIQKITFDQKSYLEVGAIFIKKEFRSFSTLKLYKSILDIARKNNLDIKSEIDVENTRSIRMLSILKEKIDSRNEFHIKISKIEKGKRLAIHIYKK